MLRGLPEIKKLLMDVGDELSAISGLGGKLDTFPVYASYWKILSTKSCRQKLKLMLRGREEL